MISWKAILLGFLTDLGGSLAAGFAFALLVGSTLIWRGMSQEEIEAHFQTDPTILASSLLIGLACSLLGGFVAGRTAGRRQVLHGAVTGLLSAASALPLSAGLPAPYVAISTALVPLAAAGGGLLASRDAAAGHATEPR